MFSTGGEEAEEIEKRTTSFSIYILYDKRTPFLLNKQVKNCTDGIRSPITNPSRITNRILRSKIDKRDRLKLESYIGKGARKHKHFDEKIKNDMTKKYLFISLEHPAVLRVLSLPSSRHYLAGSYWYQERERNNQMESTTNYDSWSKHRPRRMGDQSNTKRLHDILIPVLYSQQRTRQQASVPLFVSSPPSTKF
ncbi:hypothetical protein M9H77_07119 [Catharanthus roseus]|uniref:Uncharacterized protein n=1 Tax=Catharanthus roseus TaxID=4058 RepID=A0ACC0BU90_CATRO|nr:hypothetical protein M9H77_07119 [Catharanthus roseus]